MLSQFTELFFPKDCSGRAYATESGSRVQCADKCANDGQCTAFGYNAKNQNCRMYNFDSESCNAVSRGNNTTRKLYLKQKANAGVTSAMTSAKYKTAQGRVNRGVQSTPSSGSVIAYVPSQSIMNSGRPVKVAQGRMR